MTRRDYIALAGAISEAFAIAEADDAGTADGGIRIVAEEIARVLTADNGRFDREKFYAAAYVNR